jgi:hypothetical protein
MRTPTRIPILLCMSLLALPAFAQTAAYTQNGFNPKMLDASTPEEQRLKSFAHVIALANQGQVRAQNLAGTLYWQGGRIANSPVSQNLKQARILLANAAVHGNVLAMAKLAELELGAGRTTKAMVWAQLYAHYLNPLAHGHRRSGQRYAYASDLLNRISAKGGKPGEDVTKDVNAMVGRFDKPIRAGIDAFRSYRRHGNPRLISQPQGSVPRDLANKSGVAEFMVGFDSSGAPTGIWTIASYPSADFATELRPLLDTARANGASSDAGTRYLLVPIPHYSVRFKQLREHH